MTAVLVEPVTVIKLMMMKISKVLILALALASFSCSNPANYKQYAARCSGQIYRVKADAYSMGSGGCVRFTDNWKSAPLALVCNCDVVVEEKIQEEKK